MTKDNVLEIFNRLLDKNQDDYCYNDSEESMRYRLAYNNGLIDMRDAIIMRISNEAVENE